MKIAEKKIISSLMNKGYIKSVNDVLSIKHINVGLINYLFSIRLKNRDLIAKLARNFCRFAPDIRINKNRLEKEVQAINLFHSLIKTNQFPKIEYYDKKNSVLMMKKLPDDYKLLDEAIFNAVLDLKLPKKLGAFLAELHNATAGNKAIRAQFGDNGMLVDFKFPVLYENITNDPIIIKEIDILKNDLLSNKICLIHSDFKPNNILSTNKDFCVIDFEQSHYGDPALDICYTPAIYFLAMMRNYNKKEDYFYCIESFWKAYKRMSKFKNFSRLEKNSLRHFGVIILSRMFGMTKINSLQKPIIKNLVRALSKKLILGGIDSFSDIKSGIKRFN